MINQDIVRIAQLLDEDLSSTGQRVEAVRGDLNELTSLTHLRLPEAVGDRLANDLFVELPRQNSVEANVAHTAYQKRVEEVMERKISALVEFIKNKVIPTVGCFSETLREASQAVNVDTYELVEIIQLHLPELSVHLESGMGEDLKARAIPRIGFVKLGVAFDRRHYYAGNPQVDGMINDFIDRLGVNEAAKIFMSVYHRNMSSPALDDMIKGMNPYDRVNLATTILITIDNIAKNPPEDLSGVSLSALTELQRVYTVWASALLSKSIKLVKAYQRNTLVVRNQNPVTQRKQAAGGNGHAIYVDSAMYQRYLKEGGTVKALCGRSLKDDGVNTLDGVLKKTLSYISVYNRYEKTCLASKTHKLSKLVGNNAYNAFKELYVAECKGGYASAIPENAVSFAKAYCAELSPAMVGDTDRIAFEMVTLLLFQESPAHEILSTIDSLQVPDEKGADIDELAFIAIAVHLAKNLAASMQLSDSTASLTHGL